MYSRTGPSIGELLHDSNLVLCEVSTNFCPLSPLIFFSFFNHAKIAPCEGFGTSILGYKMFFSKAFRRIATPINGSLMLRVSMNNITQESQSGIQLM